ncbi:MAG: type II toxin-antitoxin system death-on-curing family toxin [Acidobacteriota bacterium]
MTQAHAFIDGNKRVAAAVAEVFIELNGEELKATNDEVVKLFLSIAAGKLTRDEVEAFFIERTTNL